MSLSFPLPLWSRNKAEIQTAQFTTAQAEKTLQSAELKAEVQVRQALTTDQLKQDRVKKFQSALAERVEVDLKSRKVEAVQVHHLVPRRDKVVDKFLLRVGAAINFRQRAENGV